MRSDNGLPPDVAALVQSERAAADPPPEARERVRERLQQTIGAAAGAAALAAAAKPTVASGKLAVLSVKSLAGLGAKLTVAVVAGAALAGAGLYVATRAPAPIKPPVAAAPATAAPEPKAASVPAPPSLEPARVSTKPGLRSPGRDLAAEQLLVGKARAALRDGNPAAALGALERHQHAFPNGQLAEERDSLRVRALVDRGDHDAARTRAAAFARRYPNSLFLPAVRAATAD